jgi:hypothetical protein
MQPPEDTRRSKDFDTARKSARGARGFDPAAGPIGLEIGWSSLGSAKARHAPYPCRDSQNDCSADLPPRRTVEVVQRAVCLDANDFELLPPLRRGRSYPEIANVEVLFDELRQAHRSFVESVDRRFERDDIESRRELASETQRRVVVSARTSAPQPEPIEDAPATLADATPLASRKHTQPLRSSRCGVPNLLLHFWDVNEEHV